MNRHIFLFFTQVGEVLFDGANVRPDVFPLFFTPGVLKKISEFADASEPVHDIDIVIDGKVLQPHDGFALGQQSCVFPHQTLGLRFIQLRSDAHAHHVILKIPELAVYSDIPVVLCLVYVFQFPEDHIKGLLECIEADLLMSIIPDTLYAEIRVNQKQVLTGQILQFQIPCRMVACDMRDAGQTHAQQQFICIVVMQMRYSRYLLFPAPELADIMSCSRRGHHRQIDGNIVNAKLPRHMHRDIMDAGNMTQCIEGLQCLPYHEELVQIVVSAEFHKPGVFFPCGILLGFFRA